jgi:hypothetical protein
VFLNNRIVLRDDEGGKEEPRGRDGARSAEGEMRQRVSRRSMERGREYLLQD